MDSGLQILSVKLKSNKGLVVNTFTLKLSVALHPEALYLFTVNMVLVFGVAIGFCMLLLDRKGEAAH